MPHSRGGWQGEGETEGMQCVCVKVRGREDSETPRVHQMRDSEGLNHVSKELCMFSQLSPAQYSTSSWSHFTFIERDIVPSHCYCHRSIRVSKLSVNGQAGPLVTIATTQHRCSEKAKMESVQKNFT